MISSQLSQQARHDFAVVLRMAQSIGLADMPPLSRPIEPFIVNTPAKRRRRRICNHSDLSHIQKQQKFRKVKERSASERARFTPQIVSSARKGSVKDVYVNSVQPYQDPSKFFQTQRQLLKNDEKRLLNMTRNTQRVKLMSRDKRRRSKILGQISQGVIAVSQPKSYTTAQKYFGQIKKSKVVAPRTVSQQKLSTSLDFSKFMVVPRGRCVSLLSRQGQNRRVTQTANSKRIINMRFNINNKAELLCEPAGTISSEFQQF